MKDYKFISPFPGHFTNLTYWILRYPDKSFTFGYYHNKEFHVTAFEADSVGEVEKYIDKREDLLSGGDTVML